MSEKNFGERNHKLIKYSIWAIAGIALIGAVKEGTGNWNTRKEFGEQVKTYLAAHGIQECSDEKPQFPCISERNINNPGTIITTQESEGIGGVVVSCTFSQEDKAYNGCYFNDSINSPYSGPELTGPESVKQHIPKK